MHETQGVALGFNMTAFQASDYRGPPNPFCLIGAVTFEQPSYSSECIQEPAIICGNIPNGPWILKTEY